MSPSLTPLWRFLLYPSSAISQRKIDAFVINDLMADLILGAPSSWGGVYVRGSFGSQGSDWSRLGVDLSLQNVGFARFLPGGALEWSPGARTNGAFGAFFVTPTQRSLAFAVDGGIAAGASQSLVWLSQSGSWKTSAASGNSPSGIANAGSDTGRVLTRDALPVNQSLEMHLDFVQSGNSDASHYLDLGPTLRLALEQGRPPKLLRRVSQSSGGVSRDQWTTWARLDESETFSARGTHYRFALRQLGGRLTYEWNDKAGWLLDENDAANAAAPLGIRPRALIPTWGGAPLKLAVSGCKVHLTGSTFDHKNSAGTSLQTGKAIRRVPLEAANQYAPRLLDPLAVGFVPTGGDMDVQLAHDESGLTYTTTITPSPDGLLSPCLAQMLLVYSPVWVNGSGSAIDISRAVTGANVTLAQPPDEAGTKGDISLDMRLLEKKLPAALPLLQDFAPIEISACNVADVTATPVSDFRGLLQGYLFVENGDESSFNRHTGKYNLRDSTVRLQDEAGTVDDSFYDLIMDFQRVTKERVGLALKQLNAGKDPDAYVNPFTPKTYVPRSAGNFYIADCVQSILLNHMGPAFANSLNGNGDPTRYLPKDHPPLLNRFDTEGCIAPLAAGLQQTLGIGSLSSPTNGMFFAPPYGEEDVLSWLLKLAGDEFATFWMGHADRNTDVWAQPLYGLYEEFLNSALGWRIGAKDAANLAGLIESASCESKPNKAINRVLVWSNPLGMSNDIPNSPAMVQGEARVARGPNAPFRSWMRTLLFRSGFANWINTPAQAAALAGSVLLDYDFDAGVPVAPNFKMRGDARYQVGDVFFAQDLQLRRVNDIFLRAIRVKHTYSANPTAGRSWDTTLDLATMTRSQITRFQRNHPGVIIA